MKKVKQYTDKIILSDAVTKDLILSETEVFFDNLEKKYNRDIRYNVDKITKR